VIGRDTERAALRGLVDPPPADSSVLVMLGEAGMGKTVLLTEVTTLARDGGTTVLSVAGRESERDLAFTGLHELLRPVLDRVADLPERQARALRGAFALAADPAPADELLTGMAVLTLLGALAEDGPLFVVADDAQWLDHGSLKTLAFAARRLSAEPVAVLLAVRGSVPPAGFDRGFPELPLSPLSASDAGGCSTRSPRRRGAGRGRRCSPRRRATRWRWSSWPGSSRPTRPPDGAGRRSRCARPTGSPRSPRPSSRRCPPLPGKRWCSRRSPTPPT
jgi:hypothetical protein